MLRRVTRYPDGTVDLGDGQPPVSLTADELRRSAALRSDADRDDHMAAHVLVRAAVRVLLPGRAPMTVEQWCTGCGGRGHGRPSVAEEPDLHVSLAHCRGAVTAAAGWSPVGVDVEPVAARRTPDEALLKATLSPRERRVVERHADPVAAFLRLWVRKEALIKVGALTLDRLTDADLSALPSQPGPSSPGCRPLSASGGRWAGWTFTDWWDGTFLGSAVASGEVSVAGWPRDDRCEQRLTDA